MSTSDTDKPPICLPAFGSDRPPIAAELQRDVEHDDGDASPWPASGGGATRAHWAFLALAVAVLLAACSLEVRDGEKVGVSGIDAVLPGTCVFRKATGRPCPGCGLTRSFISAAHGRIRDAWHYNPAGFFFLVVVVFQVPYRLYQIARIGRGLGAHRFTRIDTWVLVLLVIVLVVQWIGKLVAGAV
ncbi:MAG: DUF2752 domain-containing protein [Planctomycetota bacterium]